MLKADILYFSFLALFCVLLFLLAGFSGKYVSSKWKLCYLLPVLLSAVSISAAGYEKMLLPTYAASIAVIAGFFWEKPVVRRITCVICALTAVSGALTAYINPYFRAADYSAEFEEIFGEMKERYVLADHKQIDWDSLHDKYEPKFREATDMTDKKLNCRSWLELCAEFHDGHVGYVPNDEEMEKEVYEDALGRDFGLAILNYDDGRAVAVNVDPSLNELGIRDGTVILSWNGMLPEEAAKLSDAYNMRSYADSDNEYFSRSLLAAGTGKKGNVVFLDDEGNEKSAELSSIGNFYDRYIKTVEMLNDGVKTANMSFTQLNSTTVCMRVKTMFYDSASSHTDEYRSMVNTVKRNLSQYKSEGVKDLVIDLRGNGGGSGTLVKAMCALFAPKGEHLYCYDGVWDKDALCYRKNPDGTYAVGKKNTFNGEDLLEGGNIVILVNRNSASASDHMAKVMSQFDNVTIMGFTESCGSAQGVTSIVTSEGGISLSGSLILNEDGTVWIDSGADMQSGAVLDVKVPFDEEALEATFINKEDHVMNKALEYLANK